jgi:hypothetical protein
VRVIHQRQRLALGLEARQDVATGHAGPDQFQRDPAPDRVRLFGFVNLAESAFAEQPHEAIGADMGRGRGSGIGGRRRWRERAILIRHGHPPGGGMSIHGGRVTPRAVGRSR